MTQKWIVNSGEWIDDARSRRRARSSSRSTTHYPLSTIAPPAFTLIELLIVLGIIGVVVALGVPLFGVLTGSRSQEAGQNLVAAAIGQARTVALNEGKYAGILFYVDPATERTAMTLVVISDPKSGLEDADPYDKYKTWLSSAETSRLQTYRAPGFDAAGNSIRGDRVIGLATDASGTYRAEGTETPVSQKNVYTPANMTTNYVYSKLSEYFGNMKPVVRSYRAKVTSTNQVSTTASRPPRNGPLVDATLTPQKMYVRVPQNTSTIAGSPGAGGTTPTLTAPATLGFGESTAGRFQNDTWGDDQSLPIAQYSTGEQQLLPLGVGVQLIAQPTYRADTSATSASPFAERYFRTGLIMFDPQGRLTLDPRNLPLISTTGKYLALSADATGLVSGVGVVLYDRTAFRANPTFTDADWYYENVTTNATARVQSNNAALNDNSAATTTAAELAEDSGSMPTPFRCSSTASAAR